MNKSADSHLRCTVCGRTEEISFVAGLQLGWPKCCGYTMRLETTDANIHAAVSRVVGKVKP